jgi:2,4-dienoyl-CoA reductase-like NADH-dependent reductase (Old Yellow Enzyme family)
MTSDDIAFTKHDFVSAAQCAAQLGIDVIELHLAHGCLPHQLLSPLSNQRDYDYGG